MTKTPEPITRYAHTLAGLWRARGELAGLREAAKACRTAEFTALADRIDAEVDRLARHRLNIPLACIKCGAEFKAVTVVGDPKQYEPSSGICAACNDGKTPIVVGLADLGQHGPMFDVTVDP